jgi:predicted RNase H-like HicB family nuclease
MLQKKLGRLAIVSLLTIVGLFVIAACGGDDDDVASAAQSTCEALGDFRDSGLAIQALDPTASSIDDLDDATQNAKDALDNVLEAAAETEEAAIGELQGAFEEFESAVSDNSDLSIVELVPVVVPQIENIVNTWDQVNQDLQCTAAAG